MNPKHHFDGEYAKETFRSGGYVASRFVNWLFGWLIDWLVSWLFGIRYQRYDKRSKLPGWIQSYLKESHMNLSTDMALHIAREVGKEMGGMGGGWVCG